MKTLCSFSLIQRLCVTHQSRKWSDVQRVDPASVGIDLSVQDSRHSLVEADLTCPIACHHCAFPQFDRRAAHTGREDEVREYYTTNARSGTWCVNE